MRFIIYIQKCARTKSNGTSDNTITASIQKSGGKY